MIGGIEGWKDDGFDLARNWGRHCHTLPQRAPPRGISNRGLRKAPGLRPWRPCCRNNHSSVANASHWY
jgi:hypothetical protein